MSGALSLNHTPPSPALTSLRPDSATIDHQPPVSPSEPQNHHRHHLLLHLLLLLSPNNHRENLFSLSFPLSSAFSVSPPATIQCRRDHLLPLLTTSHCGSLARPCLPHSQSQNQNRATLVPASSYAVAAGHCHCIHFS
ncbi:hypothetical protein HN51_070609 [Arachis hypogaea]